MASLCPLGLLYLGSYPGLGSIWPAPPILGGAALAAGCQGVPAEGEGWVLVIGAIVSPSYGHLWAPRVMAPSIQGLTSLLQQARNCRLTGSLLHQLI